MNPPSAHTDLVVDPTTTDRAVDEIMLSSRMNEEQIKWPFRFSFIMIGWKCFRCGEQVTDPRSPFLPP